MDPASIRMYFPEIPQRPQPLSLALFVSVIMRFFMLTDIAQPA